MLNISLIFLGGGLGSVLRHVLSAGLHKGRPDPTAFPIGTLAVNIIGCVLIGAVAGYVAHREPARALFMVGLLGGFTTFSTFGLDTIRLFTEGEHVKAVVYVLLTLAACLFAVWLTFETGPPVNPAALDAD